MIAPAKDNPRPSDRQFGYEFGADGVVSRQQAIELLACHKATLYRLCQRGVIRRGRMGGRAKFCRRSISEYLRSIEA